MKKNFTIFIAMLFTIASNVFADDKLYFADFEIEPGEEKEVSILLDNPDAEYRDLQFDLYLPEGITVAQDEDEEFLVELLLLYRWTLRLHALQHSKESTHWL